MKKIMAAALLSLSIASVSCEEAKKEDTPWYTSFKKTYATLIVIDAIYYFSSPLNPQRLIITHDYQIQSPRLMLANLKLIPKNLSNRINNTHRFLPPLLLNNIFQALLISSVGKIIHNHNQKKKQKTQEIL